MMVQGVSISEMLSQSTTVLTKPSVASFEQYEKRGTQREALIYVGVATALVAVVSLVFGVIFNGVVAGILGAVIAAVGTIAMYYVFSYVLFLMGKQQGGTGTQDEVFYTTSLYVAPLLAVTGVVGAIPIIGCIAAPVTLLLAVYQLYLGYLASRASMNLDQNKAIISVAVAVVAQLVIAFIIGGITAAVVVGGAAATGALSQ